MTDVNPCVLYLRDQVVGGPVTYHEVHPAMRRMDFEDIQEEEPEEEFLEEVIEEEPEKDPQEVEMMNLEEEDEAAIWELDDVQEDFEIWEPEEEEVQEEGPVEWEFDPEEAPASDDEEFYVCHKI
ncbi:hypothetical protein RIF29_20600 [Crotalaria pallida]|uniref:Uncharacterized protein n=1 Tax=Crotalaria pallida TaxID=3830 RepID=A0AAN9F3A7_CROPI